MKYRKTIGLLTAAALSLSLVSCNTQTEAQAKAEPAASVSQPASPEATQETPSSSAQSSPKQDSRPVLGQVTSIEGSTVTVALGEMSRMQGGGHGRMSGSKAPSENSSTPPQLPEGQAPAEDSSTPPPLPEGQAPAEDSSTPPQQPEAPSEDSAQQSDGQTTPDKKADGHPKGGFTASGETVTLDLSVITVNGEAATSENLSTGSMLALTLDSSGKPVSAKVLTKGHGGRKGCPGQKGQKPSGDSQSGNQAPSESPADSAGTNA